LITARFTANPGADYLFFSGRSALSDGVALRSSFTRRTEPLQCFIFRFLR
jgi:hypothetical protein